MIGRALFGICALVPAALNAAPGPRGSLLVPLCGGDGIARSIAIPLAGGPPAGDIPGREQPGCCAKACHTGSRKRSLPPAD